MNWDLNFAGDLRWWQGVILASLLAWIAWRIYRRESPASGKWPLRFLLPLLRCAMVFALLVCLTGPVLTHHYREGVLGDVLVFVDGSASMGITDEHIDDGRKLLLAQSRDFVEGSAVDTTLLEATRSLGRAQRIATGATSATGSKTRQLRMAALQEEIRRLDTLLDALPEDHLPAVERPTGSIIVEYFDGVSGVRLDPAKGTDPFRREPSRREKAVSFQSRRNRGDSYGTRIRAHVHPPVTGDYTFWISSDDDSVLLLSSHGDLTSKKALAWVSGYAPYQDWTAHASQRSKPIALKAGERYYVEVFHLEGTGEDHVMVGWDRPDGRKERPIPGMYLSPVEDATISGPQTRDWLKKTLAREAFKPAAALASGGESAGLKAQLRDVAAALVRWERLFDNAFAAHAREVLESGGAEIREAIGEYEARTRWQRVESLLLDSTSGVLRPLLGTHELAILELKEGDVRKLWTSKGADELPERLTGEPDGKTTNLCDGIQKTLGRQSARTAAVLFSDGRHNDGGSPAELARVLEKRGVLVFTVGLGNHREPPDLAVLDVDAPKSVYAEDRIRGHILVHDRIEEGSDFSVRITHGGKEAWKKDLRTTGRGLRKIDFDFPVKELAEREKGKLGRGVRVMSVPLGLEVGIDALPGESRKENNTTTLWFRAVMHGRRILLLDGRPRWETRFVRNLFERDEQWRIDTLIAQPRGEGHAWMRGDGTGEGKFPEDREALFAYDLIVFGEVPREALRDEEREWIREFVEKRGGGIIFVDGRRKALSRFEETPLEALFPVEWIEGREGGKPLRLELTETGKAWAALRLETNSETNERLWRALPPPHWIAPVHQREGTENFAVAIGEGGETSPVLVRRRFGAGKVLYSAFDGSWRWRYEVADRYHQRYWNQLATWLMESPYAVKDRYVSLDVGGLTYRGGERAEIRARLRDREGKPMMEASAEAIIYRDGKKVATVPLEADLNQGGVFRGSTAELEPGAYEVGVLVEGFSELEMKARTTFTVVPPEGGELRFLSCDEALLRRMAETSGGAYLREEEAGVLPDLLVPLSDGEVKVRETRLGQSYWWFLPILFLLSLEWILRKRAGML